MRQPPEKSTEELARAGRQSGEQSEQTCPFCGEGTRNLPNHMREWDGGSND